MTTTAAPIAIVVGLTPRLPGGVFRGPGGVAGDADVDGAMMTVGGRLADEGVVAGGTPSRTVSSFGGGDGVAAVGVFVVSESRPPQTSQNVAPSCAVAPQ
jgi:hypothetical protein